jgi:hypothetical protein
LGRPVVPEVYKRRERSSAPALSSGASGGASSSASKASVPPPAPPAARRDTRCRLGASATAAALTGSNATARASASPAQYSTSSAFARQLSGVTTAPRSWQAQCSVAISQRLRITTRSRSPRRSPIPASPPATLAMRSNHCA